VPWMGRRVRFLFEGVRVVLAVLHHFVSRLAKGGESHRGHFKISNFPSFILSFFFISIIYFAHAHTQVHTPTLLVNCAQRIFHSM
jgi:hypothetical protein